MQQIYKRTPMPMCDLNKVVLQLYRNHTLAWMFYCNFAACFQNSFSEEHLWVAASVFTYMYLITNSIVCQYFKGNAQFVQNLTFEPLMAFKQKHYRSYGNITKAATFKSFLHLSYKNTQLLFLWQFFKIFFMRQIFTDDFWDYTKIWIVPFKGLRFPLKT